MLPEKEKQDQKKRKKKKPIIPNDDSPVIIVMPFQNPINPISFNDTFLSMSGSGEKSSSSEHSSLVMDTEGNLGYGTMVAQNANIEFHGVDLDPEVTLANIREQTGIEPNDSLTRAVQCGAFWKSVGADAIIYMSSIGVNLVANGLVIRFLGFDPFVSTLLFGSTAGMSYVNTQIIFTSLIRPPIDNIPEDKKTRYDIINKYAFLPISLIFKSVVAGTTLSMLGDTSIGTQQSVSAVTGPTVGPIMTLARTGVRKCFGGSVVIDPPQLSPGGALKRAYSGDPNPIDENRSYRWGTVRNMLGRAFGLAAGTIALTYSHGFQIQSYCGPSGQQELQNIINGGGTINGSVVNQYCFAGNMTFGLRELGIATGYSLGLLVIDPLANMMMNKVYDFFYPKVDDKDEPEMGHIEIVEDEKDDFVDLEEDSN